MAVHKDDNSKRMIAQILGQSNVGNYGPVKGAAGRDVYVLHDGALQLAIDPLPGAPHGHEGSVWT